MTIRELGVCADPGLSFAPTRLQGGIPRRPPARSEQPRPVPCQPGLRRRQTDRGGMERAPGESAIDGFHGLLTVKERFAESERPGCDFSAAGVAPHSRRIEQPGTRRMNGKGSIPRPFSVTLDEFRSSYDRIFGQKEPKREGPHPKDASTTRGSSRPATTEGSPD